MENLLPESKMPVVPPRILLGPGPSAAHPRVLQAMMSPMIGYLDPDFMLIMDEVSELLKQVFQTEESLTLALSGTGSAGMEAGLSSLLEPDETAILCVYGFFCERMVEMAGRVGANVVPLRADWGRPFAPGDAGRGAKEAQQGEACLSDSRGDLNRHQTAAGGLVQAHPRNTTRSLWWTR